MKFIVDAQLPRRVAHDLAAPGTMLFTHWICHCKIAHQILKLRTWHPGKAV